MTKTAKLPTQEQTAVSATAHAMQHHNRRIPQKENCSP
jgi:hypothetical protein